MRTTSRAIAAVVSTGALALAVSACGPEPVSVTAGGPAGTEPTTSEPTSAPTTTTATATGTPSSGSGTPSSSSTTPAPSPSTTAPAPITENTTLQGGMSGPYVLRAQQRLSALGYWLGTPDGDYGYLTSQAVMALQKAAGLGRDGVLGPRTKAALERGVRPVARTRSGSAIEVDKARQLVLVVLDGHLRYVLNTSTGSGKPYTSEGQTYVATTPEGRFSVQRQIDGMRVSRLGELWRPKYFTGGFALHGSPSVPGYPASHGCVRLSNPAIDVLWSSGVAPIGRTVWVY